jgi:2-hydroxy-3-keto-5-methylthiopentenyl-1-phosphate phosphatase
MHKVAFIYDFDKTLSPKDMQEFGLLDELGYENPRDFWELVDNFARVHEMDRILAYMYVLIEKAKLKDINLNKSFLNEHGQHITLFDGVLEWFDLINEYGRKLNLEIEHYVISSGLKQMILTTKIADQFKHIFACEYVYDEAGNVLWPSMAINYTMKTQFLFRINKGLFDLVDDLQVNESIPHDQRAIPFDQMIYIGDGITDVASMSVMKDHGGYAYAIYNPEDKKSEANALKLKAENRVDAIFASDFSWHTPLFTYMCHHLDKIAQRWAF